MAADMDMDMSDSLNSCGEEYGVKQGKGEAIYDLQIKIETVGKVSSWE